MKTKINFLLAFFILFFSVCNCSDNENADEFLGVRSFTFNSVVDSSTLIQEDSFRIMNTLIAQRNETYKIESDIDLEVFNQTLIENDHVLLDDLNVYTYFFIRDPDCPEYFDYSNHRYSNNVLTISFYHFHGHPDTVCPAWVTELYLVFKAEKIS